MAKTLVKPGLFGATVLPLFNNETFVGDIDQRQAAGSYIAESWLRKRGSDFQIRLCLGREVGNSTILYLTKRRINELHTV